MVKKKRPQLSPELRQRYREWLRGQRTGAIEYGREDDAVRDEALSDDEMEGVERWLRDVEHVDDIEFEGYDNDDEEDELAAPDAKVPNNVGLKKYVAGLPAWVVVLAVVLLVLALGQFLLFG